MYPSIVERQDGREKREGDITTQRTPFVSKAAAGCIQKLHICHCGVQEVVKQQGSDESAAGQDQGESSQRHSPRPRGRQLLESLVTQSKSKRVISASQRSEEARPLSPVASLNFNMGWS